MSLNEITYGFAKQDAEALIGIIGGGDREHIEGRTRQQNLIVHFRTKTGGLTARSGANMGVGLCDMLACSDTGALADSGVDAYVYNDVASVVGATAGTYIKAARNTAGLYVVLTEDCG